MTGEGAGSNQKRRTRKDLLRAATRLMQQGRKPSLEEVAEEALVSRATAYRYFASAEALLLEAALDVRMPEAEAVFGADASTDPQARIERLDDAVQAMIEANELQLRMMLAHSLVRDPDGDALPVRQNRRSPLIATALEPARAQFTPAALARLRQALALVVGSIEAQVVLKDVLQLDPDAARNVRRWVVRTLIAAARTSGDKDA